MKHPEFRKRLIENMQQAFDPRPQIAQDFYNFCKKKLGIQSDVPVEFLDKKTDDMTTGAIRIDTGEISVLLGNRAFVDSLRTLAHELVHLKQMEMGKPEQFNPGPEHLRDVGSPNENEANAVAGALIKEFVRTYKSSHDLYEL